MRTKKLCRRIWKQKSSEKSKTCYSRDAFQKSGGTSADGAGICCRTSRSIRRNRRFVSPRSGNLQRTSAEIFADRFLPAIFVFCRCKCLHHSTGFCRIFPDSGLTLGIINGILAVAVMFRPAVVCGSLLGGTVTWLTAQIMAYPLKPVSLRPAISMRCEKSWKKLITTTMTLRFLYDVRNRILPFAGNLYVGYVVIWSRRS